MATPKTKKTETSNSSPVPGMIAEIRSDEALLATPIEEVKRSIRAGHQILCVEAEARLKTNRINVSGLIVPKRLVGLFLTASLKTVAEIEEVMESGGIFLRADALWQAVCDNVEPSMGPRRDWGQAQWGLVMSGLSAACTVLGCGVPDISVERGDDDTSYEGNLAYIRSAVLSSRLPDLNARLLRKQIVDAVISRDLTADKVPVVVVGAAPEEVGLRGLFSRSATVELPEEISVTMESVSELFKQAV